MFAGTLLEGQLYQALGTHGAAGAALAMLLPAAAIVVLLAVPETANRELEEIAAPHPSGRPGNASATQHGA